MTRINAGIKVEELHHKHLLAETREIKRVPNLIKNGKYSMVNQPKEFTLGTGHVKFFYDKLKYLHKRYCLLYDECIKRGYNVQSYHSAFHNLPDHLYNDYVPTENAIMLIKQRIKERLSTMKTI